MAALPGILRAQGGRRWAGILSGELYGPAFFEGRSQTVSASASAVVAVLQELLQPFPTSVVDIGCGYGEWLDAFPDTAEKFGVDIAAADAVPFYQGNPWQLLVHDLTEPLYLGRIFDLALSLETGEHLPEEAADVYVASISRHSDLVLFSAATPGQEGKGHINCQPHAYWHEKFALQGFELRDVIRSRIAMDARISQWYRDNLFLYVR